MTLLFLYYKGNQEDIMIVESYIQVSAEDDSWDYNGQDSVISIGEITKDKNGWGDMFTLTVNDNWYTPNGTRELKVYALDDRVWHINEGHKKYRPYDLESLTKFRNALVKKFAEEKAKKPTEKELHINEVHKLMEKYGLTVKDLVK
jgi:hypothetical protein